MRQRQMTNLSQLLPTLRMIHLHFARHNSCKLVHTGLVCRQTLCSTPCFSRPGSDGAASLGDLLPDRFVQVHRKSNTGHDNVWHKILRKCRIAAKSVSELDGWNNNRRMGMECRRRKGNPADGFRRSESRIPCHPPSLIAINHAISDGFSSLNRRLITEDQCGCSENRIWLNIKVRSRDCPVEVITMRARMSCYGLHCMHESKRSPYSQQLLVFDSVAML